MLAARLRQSVLLGYIGAGMVIGPFTPGPVGDLSAVQALADIGIIFLMFAIGVELSVHELVTAGPVALVGGAAQVLFLVVVGLGVGAVLGLGGLEPLYLGAVIAISSTAVLTKLLAESGELGSVHGRLVITWGAVQDIATVVLMVVLSALSTAGGN